MEFGQVMARGNKKKFLLFRYLFFLSVSLSSSSDFLLSSFSVSIRSCPFLFLICYPLRFVAFFSQARASNFFRSFSVSGYPLRFWLFSQGEFFQSFKAFFTDVSKASYCKKSI
uniref:Uncharacterized protein n=1 Tax=Cucumis melo TaxID=3656 RepID=A0A9I9E875_CUCME